MPEQDPLQLLRDATRADQSDLDALRAGLPIDLSTVAEEEPAVVAEEPSRRLWPWGLAVAAAAAAALAIALDAPEPVDEPAPQVVAAAPVVLDGPLAQGVVEIEPGIRLIVDGTGRLEGTSHNAIVHWDDGHLDVEVDPNADVRLSVRTEAGEVDVLGTVFAVDQGPDGLLVALERGRVEVRCEHGDGALLEPGQAHTCHPMTAGKALNLANSLRDDPAALLAASERGLHLASAGSAIEGELQVRRIEALMGLDRPDEALQQAQEYLRREQRPRHDAVCARVKELGGTCE